MILHGKSTLGLTSRLLMILLILQTSWLTTAIPSQADILPPTEADCRDEIGLSPTHEALWEYLGLPGYTWCDAWATLDDDLVLPYEPDPNDPNDMFVPQYVTGRWGDYDFYLLVDEYVPLTDWQAVFPDDPNLAADAQAANANAGVFVATLNDAVTVSGVFIAVDDIWNHQGRMRFVLICSWEPAAPPLPEAAMLWCGNDDAQQKYSICVNTATNNYKLCMFTAKANFTHCVTAAVATSIGSAVGCVITGVKSGMGAVAIKALLIACGVGALLSLVAQLIGCVSRYNTDKSICVATYRTALATCRLACTASRRAAQVSSSGAAQPR